MMASAHKPSSENWLRLACMVYDEIQPALLNILHNTHNDVTYKGFSQYGPDLYKELDLYRPHLTALIKKKVLSKKQFELLLSSCQSTNSSKFDITLLVAVIRNCLNIPAPSSWDFHSLDTNDMSIASYIVRGKEIRNKVCHSQPGDIDDATFNTYWKEGEIVLRGLRHQCDMNALMSKPLDSRTLSDRVKLDNVQDKVDDLDKDFETLKTDFKGVKSEIQDVRRTIDSVEEKLKQVTEQKNISPSSNQTKEEVDRVDLKDAYKKKIMNCRREKNEQYIIKRKFRPDKCPEEAILSKEAVLIHAAAGVGKTIYTTDMLHRWAYGDILTDYFVLNYDCKDLNKHAKMTADMSPIYFSRLKELSTNKGQQLFADCERMMDGVESFLQQGKLIVLIDGVDEIALEQYLTVDAKDILQTRIDTCEEISGLDTLAAIMFGLVLPNTKIIVSGRNTDIEQMQLVKGGPTSNAFNEDRRMVLKLKEFSDIDVKKLVHMKMCGGHDNEFYKNEIGIDKFRKKWTMDTNCKDVYNRFKDVKFKNNPSLLSHLIDIYKNNTYSERMGTITKTKLFVAVILNHLHKHTELGKTMTHPTFHHMFSTQEDEFKHCLQSLAAISYHGILNEERKVIGVQEGTKTKYYGVELNEKICGKIDIFYVKPEENSVEARHILFMEFLCAVHYALHKDTWDTLAELKHERKIVILPFMAGLLADFPFVKDFVNCMGAQVHTTTELYESLFADDSKFTNDSNFTYDDKNHGWNGVWYDRYISFKLLYTMKAESSLPLDIRLLPNDLVYYYIVGRNSPTDTADLFHLTYIKDVYGLDEDQEINLPTFCERYPSVRITIKGWMTLYTDEDVSTMNMVVVIPQVHAEIGGMFIENNTGTIVNYQFLQNILIDKLCVSGCHQQFLSIMDTISQTCITTSCISSLEIDYSEVSANDMRHVLDAGCKVEMLCIGSLVFMSDHCKEICRLIEVNHDYRSIKMMLDDDDVSEEQYIRAISHFFYLHLDLDITMTDDLLEILTKSSHHPSYHRHYSDAAQQYLLHQYQVDSPNKPLVKIDGGRDYMYDKGDTGVLMLDVGNIIFSEVSPENFGRSLSNIPVVCIHDYAITPITSDQWEAFGRLINAGNHSIRELRLWSQSFTITNMSSLVPLSSIPMLQIVGYRRRNLFQQYLQYIMSRITEKHLRIFVTKGRRKSYNERLIFNEPIMKTKEKSTRNKIEYEMRQLKFMCDKDDDGNYDEDDNFNYWVIELTTSSKNRCLLM